MTGRVLMAHFSRRMMSSVRQDSAMRSPGRSCVCGGELDDEFEGGVRDRAGEHALACPLEDDSVIVASPRLAPLPAGSARIFSGRIASQTGVALRCAPVSATDSELRLDTTSPPSASTTRPSISVLSPMNAAAKRVAGRA